jgi:hypothetical protein
MTYISLGEGFSPHVRQSAADQPKYGMETNHGEKTQRKPAYLRRSGEDSQLQRILESSVARVLCASGYGKI